MTGAVLLDSTGQATGSGSAIQQGALGLALAGLHQRQLAPELLSRVSVERDGTLHMEAESCGAHRWFRFESGAVEELRPREDGKIPILGNDSEKVLSPIASVISYRPGRRIVLGSDSPDKKYIVKGYKRRGSEAAASRHEIAVIACEKGGFQIPRLVKHSRKGEYLVMAKNPGMTPDISADSIGIWAGIGARLRHFQSAVVDASLPKFDSRDELAVLDERARRFLLCMPALPLHWQEGRELLGEVSEKLPRASACLAHRDLHDGQFLVDGDVVTLLDFDLLCAADPALDAGNLVAHLVLRTLQSGRDPAESTACSQAFLASLARQSESGFNRRLLFYQASTFYRLALLYALRPRWAHLTAALTERGKLCVEEYHRKGE